VIDEKGCKHGFVSADFRLPPAGREKRSGASRCIFTTGGAEGQPLFNALREEKMTAILTCDKFGVMNVNMNMNKDKLILFFLAVLAVIAVGFVLKLAKPVILPLAIAWLLTFVVGPAVNAMTQRKIPLPIAIAVVMLCLCGVVFLGVFFLYGRVVTIVTEFPKYEARFLHIGEELNALFPFQYNLLADSNWRETVHDMLAGLPGSFFTLLSNLVMVMIFLAFLLAGKPYVKHKMDHALSEKRAAQVKKIVGSISSEISRYLWVMVIISLSTGVLIWLALSLIGVDFPVTWGALAFFFNFIPTIGSIVASLPPILLALVQFYPAVWPGVATLVAITAIQMTIGNFIAPKVLGDRLHLSPVVILISLLFWGWLWGIVGALLAVPIASAIKIACENIEELHPIAIMMGSGRRFWKESRKVKKSDG
jgi:predicted PurR-regulated permease PerM